MKIQDLAIIFIIIIFPISIVLSTYTQLQIKTIKVQTDYDERLTAATLDAIKAFQLNTINSSTSDLANSKIRDIEASVSTFKSSIKSIFGLNGYTDKQMEEYIPALVYTMYDGFYIYSKFYNQNYTYAYEYEGGAIKRDENGEPIYALDSDGNKIQIDNNEEYIFGLKPYISYSVRYIRDNIDVVITYSLDNYIVIQGWKGTEYINDSGYLIDGIEVNGDIVKYNGIEIKNETLYDKLPGINGLDSNTNYQYVRFNGTKYYLDTKGTTEENDDRVFYFQNGKMMELDSTTDAFGEYKELIINNNSAKNYYKEAHEFTNKYKDLLEKLTYGDAWDYKINEDKNSSDYGTIQNVKLWSGNNGRIFQFNESGSAEDNIECQKSSFNNHRLDVIKNKIRTNLAIAVSNFNSDNSLDFEMPELTEEEWSHIMNNISLISFVQGLDIGGKLYNGYTIVNNSESKEVVREENIFVLGEDGFYYRIGDKYLDDSDNIKNDDRIKYYSAGRLNLDFNRQKALDENEATYYYYQLKDFYASYSSIVNQNNCEVYDDIYEYISGKSKELKEAFYTALGRERYGMYKTKI